MRVVGIKALKDKLSEYIRAVNAGETILVTDRDRVVAEITAPSQKRPATAKEARWQELVRQGLVTPGSGEKGPLPPRKPIMTFEELMRELDADREDRI